ncbi:hypothetical protein [Paenibacillus sp. Marseille-Q4541]|uniref:hypothetical protein n=1 Tax=Paenibacillus sp. Marseille-Q4541 TaxID=2831522 RepID=UPI001BAB8D5A|nr:hypothetical protein [Paenibacillus sp. Marseille-Q4541]
MGTDEEVKGFTAKMYDGVTDKELWSLDNLTTHNFEYLPSSDRPIKKLPGLLSCTLTLEKAEMNMKTLRNMIMSQNETQYTLKAINTRFKRLQYIVNRTKNKRIKSKTTKTIRKIDPYQIYSQLSVGMTVNASSVVFEKVKGYRNYIK